MKSIWSSKTFWFNVITILLGFAEVVAKTYPIPPEVLALIIGLGNLVLRMITSQPVTIGRVHKE